MSSSRTAPNEFFRPEYEEISKDSLGAVRELDMYLLESFAHGPTASSHRPILLPALRVLASCSLLRKTGCRRGTRRGGASPKGRDVLSSSPSSSELVINV